MFKLATHYWEAAWLQELKSFIDNNENEANSPRKIARRVCSLTLKILET
jgi:hypothetical protein